MYRSLYIVVISLCSLASFAQIPVADEPLHHVIFEDNQVRVLEIIALPGDTSLTHQHDYNYCYIAVKGGKLWLEDEGEKSREVNLPNHYCGGKSELENNPFIHRFANIDTSEVRFFTVERKPEKSTIPRKKSKILDPEKNPNVILENELFRVQKREIPPKTSMALSHTGKSFLLNLSSNPLFYLGNDEVSYWTLHEGEEKMKLSNLSGQTILFAIFEIY